MKWVCMVMGILFCLIVELMSPWPQFILGVADKLQADPAVASDIMLPTLVVIFSLLLAYALFPAIGAGIGYLVGLVWERKLQ